MKLDTGAILKESWNTFKRYQHDFLKIGLLVASTDILWAILDWIEKNRVLTTAEHILLTLANILLAFVALVLWLGLVRLMIDIVRGDAPKIDTLFSQGNLITPLLWVGVLVLLVVLLGTIAFIIPGLILAIGLTFAPYLLIDKGLRGKESLKESWNITYGFKKSLVWFMFVAGIISSIGYVTVIGSIVTIPLSGLMYAYAYQALLEHKERKVQVDQESNVSQIA